MKRFSTRDLLVLVFVMAILAALVGPSIQRWRARSRLEQCQENLRTIGRGCYLYADSHPREPLSSGAPDYLLDGKPQGASIDTVGWVADALNRDPGMREFLVCSENPVRRLETLNDVARDLSMADARSLYDRGYNTNYTASWHFARTSPRLNFTQPPQEGEMQLVGPADWTDRSQTIGPLTLRYVYTSPILASLMPILADASPWGAGGTAKSVNPGPAFVSGTSLKPIPPSTILNPQAQAERNGATIKPVAGTNLYMQDTRGWGTPHAGQCNVLMVDGSVQVFEDLNDDGLLNPGFPVPDNASPRASHTYRDATVELPRNRCFNGVFIIELMKMSQF